MRNKIIIVCLVFVMLALVPATQAEDFNLTGTQHKDVTTSYGSGYLYASSSVDVLQGGIVNSLYADDTSTVNVSGGSVKDLWAIDLRLGQERINISGGSVNKLYALIAVEGNEHLSYTGALSDIASYGVQAAVGTVNNFALYSISAYNNSSLDISSGSVSSELYCRDNSTVNMTGGSVNTFYVHDLRLNGQERVNISGGSITTLYAGITLEGNEHLSYTGSISDIASYGVQVAEGTVKNEFGLDYISAYNESTMDISGHMNVLNTYDNSTADISGSLNELHTNGNSIVYIYGMGELAGSANDNSTVNVSGDVGVNDFCAYDNSTINVSGNCVGDFWAYDASTVNVFNCNLFGGVIQALNNSTVNVFGGALRYLFALDASTVNIFDGSIDYLGAYGGTVNISGGSIDELYASKQIFDSSVIFDGYDFVLGSGLSWNIDGETILGTGILTGKWFDGTSWSTNIIAHDTTTTIMAIPEPCTMLLLGLGGLLLRRRKK